MRSATSGQPARGGFRYDSPLARSAWGQFKKGVVSVLEFCDLARRRIAAEVPIE